MSKLFKLYKDKPRKIQLLNVRLSYAHLHEPQVDQDTGKKSFNTVLLLDKDEHAETIEKLQEMIEFTAKEKWEGKGPGILKTLYKKDRVTLRDGADNEKGGEAYANAMSVSSRNATKPTLVGLNREPLDKESGKPYSGCYANVVIELWAQDMQGEPGKRINASLMGVQFYKDGERLGGGGVAASDEFEEIESDETEEEYAFV